MNIFKLLSCFLAIVATGTLTPELLGVQEEQLRDDQSIVSIPVSISTKFQVGEEVKLILETTEGTKETIVDQVKVFRIGDVKTVETGEDTIFVRFVSITTTEEQATQISNSMKNRNGVFILQRLADEGKVAPPGEENSFSTPDTANTPIVSERPGMTTRLPLDSEVANNRQTSPVREPQSTQQSPLQQPANSKVVLNSQQLREVARMFELQAATLEDNGKFEKADLIRQAVQKLREAARVN